MLAEKRASTAITQVLVLLGIVAGVAIAVRMPSPVSDEWYYQDQIRMFHDGDWSLVPVITMIPGYHAAVGLITRLFGEYSNTTARMVNVAGSLPLLVLAWRLAERNYLDSGAMRAAQTFFLPLLYPFFFLIYTETWSITLLVGMMLATLGGRVALAALAAVASMAIRQDFVIWAAFALLLLALEEATWSARLRRAIAVGWPLIGAGALFVAFFVANGFSVALGDKPMHASPHNATNLYVCLLYAFVLFIPYHAWNAPKVIALLRKPWIAVAVACGFAVYWQTFSNSHPDNQSRHWLHNEVLYWMMQLDWLRALLYLPMAWAALSFAASRLPERRFEWLYAFAGLSVFLHPLVEERYYLPGFVLFNLWRPSMPERWEWAMLLAYVAVSLYLFLGIASVEFFP